jgi:hypothetical protein
MCYLRYMSLPHIPTLEHEETLEEITDIGTDNNERPGQQEEITSLVSEHKSVQQALEPSQQGLTNKNNETQDNNEKRREEAKTNILNFLRRLPKGKNSFEEDDIIERYVSWVKISLTKGLNVNINERNEKNEYANLEFYFFQDKNKVGGLSKNQTRTSVECIHPITGTRAKVTEGNIRQKNKEAAIEQVKRDLSRHLNDWEIYLSPGKGSAPTPDEISSVDPDLVLELLLELEEMPEFPDNEGEKPNKKAKKAVKQPNFPADEAISDLTVNTIVPEHWREGNEIGYKAEVLFLQAMKTLGIKEVEPQMFGQKLNYEAIFRAPIEDDFAEGYDFAYYNPIKDEWIKFDLTVSTDPDRINKKLEKEKATGIRLLRLSYGTIDRASRGSEIDMKFLKRDVREVLIRETSL